MINRTQMLVTACSFLLSACATMMSGPRQSVKIDSVPQGARVFTAVLGSNRQGTLLKRTEVGVTPMTVSIPRKNGIVELEKEGYQLTRVPMRRGTNPWFFGNVALTSMLSSAVDSSSGAIHEYDSDQYLVELPRDDAFLPGPGPGPANPGVVATDPSTDGEDPWIPDVRPLGPPPVVPQPAASKPK